MKLISLLLGSAIVALVAGITSTAQAASFTIPLNTGTSGKNGVNSGEPDPAFTWNYTGNFADPRYQAYTAGNSSTWIMAGGDLSANNHYGPDVPVATPSYQGVAFLYFTFDLPAEATNVKLNLNSVFGDDRVVLSLNQRDLGGFSPYLSSSSVPTAGVMMDANLKYVSHTFVSSSGPYTYNDQSLFNIGGHNVFRFWQNNTNSVDPSAPAHVNSYYDGSDIAISGAVSYTTLNTEFASVPEPASSWALLAIGAIGAGFIVRKKKMGY